MIFLKNVAHVIHICAHMCLYAYIHTHTCACVLSLQLCPTLCDAMDCSPPGSSDLGILWAGILEWVAMPSPRGSSRPGIEPESPGLQADSLLLQQRGGHTGSLCSTLQSNTIL